MIKAWTDDAWHDHLWWWSQDRKTLKRINSLVKDIEREPFAGLGKPEPLRGNLSGKRSRRINHADRLIYEVRVNTAIIYSAKDHYL